MTLIGHIPAASTPSTPVAAGLLARFLEVRALTERLAGPLSAEDQTAQSMPDASPTKWHRAHTSWFFEEFLFGPAGGYRPFDPMFGYLERSEQTGLATLLKGLFGTFRNPTAHAPKVVWATSAATRSTC